MVDRSAESLYRMNFGELDSMLSGFFTEKPGPGDMPEARVQNESVDGLIVPDDSVWTSGYSIAWAYKRISETAFKDVYVIIGHSEGDDSKILLGNIGTPFGVIRSDDVLANSIHKMCGIRKSDIGSSKITEETFLLHLPFLQFVSKDRLDRLKVLCISLGKDITLDQMKILSDAIRVSASDLGRTMTNIATSSLTHYGKSFDFVPFIYNVRECIEDIDYRIIDMIKRKSYNEVYSYVSRENVSVYGFRTVVLLLMLMPENSLPKLLQYYNSSYIEKKDNDMISHLSMEFSG